MVFLRSAGLLFRRFFVSFSRLQGLSNLGIDVRLPRVPFYGSDVDVFPQQPERLGVLPIKLRGGLGQRPEIWSPGSERFRRNGTGSERFRSEGSIHEMLGSERFRRNGTGSERFRSEGSIHEMLGSEVKVPFMKCYRFRELPKEWNRFREVPK